MEKHLKPIDDSNAAELAAMSHAFDWAVDTLGFMPDEIADLLRPVPGAAAAGRGWGRVVETRVRKVVDIAAFVSELLGDADEIREWLRSPNPGLWSKGEPPVRLTPARVMLDYADGVRCIRAQLAVEHRKRFALGWSVGPRR